jgi:hypothetical protein
MSFREKMAWISVVSVLGIYGYYFWSIVRTGSFTSGTRFGGLVGTVIALIVVQVVLTISVAIFAPKEADAPRDERDKLIGLRATQVAYVLLVSCIACACFMPPFAPQIPFNPNTLLLVLVIAELLRSASEIFQYRVGA